MASGNFADAFASKLKPPESRFARYRNDPLRFVVDILHADPDEWQRECLVALGAGQYVAVRSGHGIGKTAFLAWCVIWWLCTRDDAKVPCTAPTAHQLEDLLWSEIHTWIDRGDLSKDLRWEAKSVRATRSPRTILAVARVASTVEALAGFHATNLLYVVDEASGIEELMMLPVQGALSTEGAQLVMVGNPTRGDGYFAERFTRTSTTTARSSKSRSA